MSNPVELVFGQAPIAGSPVDLVFGDIGDAGGPAEVTLLIAVEMPEPGQLTPRVKVAPVSPLRLTAAMPAPALGAQVSAVYDVQIDRSIEVGDVTQLWQAAATTVEGAQGVHQSTEELTTGAAPLWEQGLSLQSATQAYHTDDDRVSSAAGTAYEDCDNVSTRQVSGYQDTDRDKIAAARAAYQRTTDLAGEAGASPFQSTLRDRVAGAVSFWEGTAGVFGGVLSDFSNRDAELARAWAAVYQNCMEPLPGTSDYTLPPKELCYIPPRNPVPLLFKDAPGGANLVFYCERDTPLPPEPVTTVSIPVRKVYIVENEVLLRRVDNGKILEAERITLSLDVSSWTWTFSATVSPLNLPDLQRLNPLTPVELDAVVNGHSVRVLAENLTSNRTWDVNTLTVGGRGISAMLGDPFASATTFGLTSALTAQQLANQVLSFNGVPIGWEVDWGLVDWLVPADASWSVQGRYMDALNDIAASVGGYVHPDPVLQKLYFKKTYPTLPWDWAAATPNFVLPSDAVTVEGMEYANKPAYNRVFVSGGKSGVSVQATRALTSGGSLAGMVVHPLITQTSAARSRAETVLANTGAQIAVQLRTPVFPESGLILPGNLVRYEDGPGYKLGLSRAISVEATPDETWQTIEVETHA